ncbi:MAG: hypothetical protein AB8B72_07835 [Crocinitomicaceae bacterium]
MEARESIRIIERMLEESRNSLSNYSFHFILWAVILIPCGIIEWYFSDVEFRFLVWPIAGMVGGIIATIYGFQQSKQKTVKTLASRVSGFAWGGFGICMIFSIFYSITLNVPPHTLILLLAGAATFTTGGMLKFKPFVFGGLFLMLSAFLCGFFVEPINQGLVFSAGLAGGYLVPGLMLRKIEYGKA